MIELRRCTKNTLPTKLEILAYFSREKLSPHSWSNSPNYEYPIHDHSYTKVIFCLKGEIEFIIHPDKKSYNLNPGDKLVVSTGTIHSAIVGPQGVTCIEAVKY